MADFYEYASVWDTAKQHVPGVSRTKFYRDLCRRHLKNYHPAKYRHALAEQRWTDDGCPYYRLHEDAIHLLRNISLNIPFRCIQAPFDVFSVHFPRPNSLVFGDGRHVRSMLVSLLPDHVGAPLLTLLVDWGQVDPAPPHVPLMHGISLEGTPDDDIGEKIDLFEATPGSEICLLAGGMDRACVRLAVSVCFLATSSDKAVRPDVLSKDLAEWLEAQRRGDEAQQQTIEARAKRRGKLGWVVGGSERQLFRRDHDTTGTSGPRGELHYRHVRSAHFRLLPNGKVVFVRQTTVRPDLPPPT